ncbi:MAG: HAMP domain-containing histidine kinase [Lachnospiraceae bacterium]|nr:HAMP domain-containing histidine kinase [Lachnospiraceae bacterium]
MDKVKLLFHNLSLRKSIIVYITIFAFISVILSTLTASFCNTEINHIRESYPPSGKKFYLTTEDGTQLGEGAYIGTETTDLSKEDERLLSILELLPIIATPLYSALCIIAAALLFYKNKLKKPLTELREASEKISSNNLNFAITYDSKDEMGQLCTSFEIMRHTLAENFSEMWRQVEERKQLNAAFAHDLRTPLTVLKGYAEMLQTSDNVQTKETAVTMGKHISRMEVYINSMSSLRRLEDTRPDYKSVPLPPFLSSLQESAHIVCAKNGKTLYLQNEISVPQLVIDTEFISQVCNNLVENAARYAGTSATLSFCMQDEGLLLAVSDDGKGFDKRSLHKASNPYFTEENDYSEHLGLGLYICKLLCEHHGGYLKIDNISNGAKVSAFFKSPEL